MGGKEGVAQAAASASVTTWRRGAIAWAGAVKCMALFITQGGDWRRKEVRKPPRESDGDVLE